MDANSPCLSFIIVIAYITPSHPVWAYASESVSDLLGFEQNELLGKPFMDLIHPEEYVQVERLQASTIRENKAACIAYLRLRHKDPYRGYILCALSQTNVHDVIVGSISFASPGAKAMHNASTAQEVTIITPGARHFEFRRWNDPSPLPNTPISPTGHSSPISSPFGSPVTSSSSAANRHRSASGSSPFSSYGHPQSFAYTQQAHLQQQRQGSVRTALILDRFSENAPVMYITNDELLAKALVERRSFFDFVAPRDEAVVRSWIEVVKGWGVNERGTPSDGGFGFGKFAVCMAGRDSGLRSPENPPSRHRQALASSQAGPSRQPSGRIQGSQATNTGRLRMPSRLNTPHTVGEVDQGGGGELMVDAIFSAHSDGVIVILRLAQPTP